MRAARARVRGLIQFVFRASKSFRSFAISESFGREVAGCVVGRGNEAEDVRFGGNAEAELRRNGRGRRGDRVRREVDAFILPTGTYPNNTCISSTPVAHRLSSRAKNAGGDAEGTSEARGTRGMAGKGEAGKYNKLQPRERRNNGIIAESTDYVIHRRRREKPFSRNVFRYRVPCGIASSIC